MGYSRVAQPLGRGRDAGGQRHNRRCVCAPTPAGSDPGVCSRTNARLRNAAGFARFVRPTVLLLTEFPRAQYRPGDGESSAGRAGSIAPAVTACPRGRRARHLRANAGAARAGCDVVRAAGTSGPSRRRRLPRGRPIGGMVPAASAPGERGRGPRRRFVGGTTRAASSAAFRDASPMWSGAAEMPRMGCQRACRHRVQRLFWCLETRPA